MNPDHLSEKCLALLAAALAEKGEAIMSTLQDSPDGKHGFGVKFNLTFAGAKVYIEGKLSHSTTDSTEFKDSFNVDDPSNPPLPGIGESFRKFAESATAGGGSVTLEHAGKTVVLDAAAAERIRAMSDAEIERGGRVGK